MKINFELKHEGVVKFVGICILALVVILLISGTIFMLINAYQNLNKSSTTAVRYQKVVEKETVIVNNTPTIVVGTKEMICIGQPNATEMSCYKQ